jgi:hypothetical protein
MKKTAIYQLDNSRDDISSFECFFSDRLGRNRTIRLIQLVLHTPYGVVRKFNVVGKQECVNRDIYSSSAISQGMCYEPVTYGPWNKAFRPAGRPCGAKMLM